MRGEAVDDAAILAEIAPAFIEKDGRRTDIVVLACTHYPFLLAAFRAAGAVAGRVDRPGAGDRAARGRGDGRDGAGRRQRRGHRPPDVGKGRGLPATAPASFGALGLEPQASGDRRR